MDCSAAVLFALGRARGMFWVYWKHRDVSHGSLAAAKAKKNRSYGTTYNMRASLFLRSRKRPICTPKTINEVDSAVRKATRLMPRACWAEPGLSAAVVDAAGGSFVVVDIFERCM